MRRGKQTIGTCFRSPSLQILEGTVRRPAGASPLRKWVLAVWTAELIHEIWDHTVKVESIVEARIGEVCRGKMSHGSR